MLRCPTLHFSNLLQPVSTSKCTFDPSNLSLPVSFAAVFPNGVSNDVIKGAVFGHVLLRQRPDYVKELSDLHTPTSAEPHVSLPGY